MGKPLGISRLWASEQEVVGRFPLGLVEAFWGRIAGAAGARGIDIPSGGLSLSQTRSRIAFGGNHGPWEEDTWWCTFLEILESPSQTHAGLLLDPCWSSSLLFYLGSGCGRGLGIRKAVGLIPCSPKEQVAQLRLSPECHHWVPKVTDGESKHSSVLQLGLYVEVNLLECSLMLHSQSLKNVKPSVPVILLLGMYSCQVTRDGMDFFMRMFIELAFVIVQVWKQSKYPQWGCM